MTEDNEGKGQAQENAAAEKAPDKKSQIATAAKGLKASGFNKEQIADQLSLKFAVTKDEVAAVLEQDDVDNDAKKKDG